mgnify:CR=1 FL=1
MFHKLNTQAALYPAEYTRTLVAGQLGDADGIKLSFATPIAPATYSGVTLDGALAGPGPASLLVAVPFRVTVATSASVGTYNTADPIVVTGTNEDGVAQAESIYLTQANGNETVSTVAGFLTVISVAFPAQVDALGAITIGSGDAWMQRVARLVRAGSIGNIVAMYEDGSTDTLPCQLAEKHDAFLTGLSSTSTSWPITLYF